MAETRTTRLTYADLERMFPEDHVRRELVGGELYVSPSADVDHQEVSLRLGSLLLAWAQRAGGRALLPVDVEFAAGELRQPDLTAFLPGRLPADTRRPVRVVPDLAVEITSPSNRRDDFTWRKDTFERFGVPEYWLVTCSPGGCSSSASTTTDATAIRRPSSTGDGSCRRRCPGSRRRWRTSSLRRHRADPRPVVLSAPGAGGAARPVSPGAGPGSHGTRAPAWRGRC